MTRGFAWTQTCPFQCILVVKRVKRDAGSLSPPSQSQPGSSFFILPERMARSSQVLLSLPRRPPHVHHAHHIMLVLGSVLGNLKPLWNCNFRAQCLFFLKCTQGISYSSHKSAEFMHSCNTLYVLMVHCFKNSRWEIMINIMRIFFPSLLHHSAPTPLSLDYKREGCETCLLTSYNAFNVLVRAANKTWLMSSSLLLKIRVALQSGDRESAINLRQNEQSNNHSSEMKSTYINTCRHSAENINTGPWARKLAPFIHIFMVRGRVLERILSRWWCLRESGSTKWQSTMWAREQALQSLGQWMS